MSTIELDNAQWGFESSCFVCERTNERGLRIAFAHDPQADAVVADFTLDAAFSGAPSYVHGGIVLAVLDEAMAWATIAVAHKFAMTRETTTRFDRPVRIDRPHRVEAHVVAVADDLLHTEATIRDAKARLCATAQASFVPLGDAQAARAIGEAVRGDDAAYLR